MSDSFPALTKEQLDSLRKGDEAAWTAFVTMVMPVIDATVAWGKWRFIPQVRQDLAQRILSVLPQALNKYTGGASVKTFIQRICIYQCIDEVRRQFRERQVFVDVQGGGDDDADVVPPERDMPSGEAFDPVQVILKRELGRLVLGLLESMEERCRVILRLFYIDDLPYKDIAQRLQIAINTVGARLSRCYEQFKSQIKNSEDLRNYFFG